MIYFLWFLCAGVAYCVSIDEEKPSVSKQFKMTAYSLAIFPFMIGLAVKKHMDNIKKITECLENNKI